MIPSSTPGARRGHHLPSLLGALAVVLGGAPAAQAAQPLGHLDAATPTLIGGWAFDPDHPAASIAVHVYVDGAFFAAATTTGHRPDVNAAFGLTGDHGFTLSVELEALGLGDHQVMVYAIDLDGEGNPAIDGSPATVSVTCPPSCSGPPTGSLDKAEAFHFAGWAKDPDSDAPLQVHLYVDGVLVKALTAGDYRPDVGFHGFNWTPPPYGAGAHQVVAHAIGVDATGAPNGENPSLDHSPITLAAGCAGLAASALGWCQGMAPYWIDRQSTTELVGDDSVRVGVDRSFGGTIFQLYGQGWDENLILEHGGGAVQLSIWGYDPVGPAGWFALDACDPTPYASNQACLAAGHSACVARAFSDGAHVLDCVTAQPCGGWTAGAPWNPIQAQGPLCGWDSPLNDVSAAGYQGATYYTSHAAPFHFTSTLPAAPMPMEQWVTPHAGYAEVRYRLSYDGPTAWSPHPQEIPAIFTAPGVRSHYYYYGGDAPFTGAPPTHLTAAPNTHLRWPDRPVYGHADFIDYATEGWWGVCDDDQDRCLTLAAFDPLMNEASLSVNQDGESGYLTALGYFGVEPGMSHEWTVYFFPYRYDHVLPSGLTVRQTIAALAPLDFGCAPTCGVTPALVDTVATSDWTGLVRVAGVEQTATHTRHRARVVAAYGGCAVAPGQVVDLYTHPDDPCALDPELASGQSWILGATADGEGGWDVSACGFAVPTPELELADRVWLSDQPVLCD